MGKLSSLVNSEHFSWWYSAINFMGILNSALFFMFLVNNIWKTGSIFIFRWKER